MKKLILFLSIALMIMSSCGNKNAYTVTGKLPDSTYNGKTMYLQTLDAEMKPLIIDSTIVQNGEFKFEGIAGDTAMICFLALGRDTYSSSFFVKEKGKIDIVLDTLLNYTAKGTPMNDSYQKYADEEKAFHKLFDNSQEELKNLKDTKSLTAEKFEEFEKKSNEIWSKYQKLLSDYIEANANNVMGESMFLDRYYHLKQEDVKRLIEKFSPEFKARDRVVKIMKRAEAAEATAEGKQFTDITGLTLDGKKIALSDYAGKGKKVILVDFWASWCGPCIGSLPGLVEIYKEYKNKGFEIVGVSLDTDKDAWAKATKTHGVVWPQMSNLKGWDDQNAVTYGVNSIPHTILIDKDGKILKKNLGEDGLRFTLEKLLKK